MTPLEVFEPVDAHDRRLALGSSGALADFNRAGVLSAADVHVARTLARAAREQDEVAVLGAAFATRAVRLGSVAVDLAQLAADGRAGAVAGEAQDRADEPLPWPDPDTWLARVQASKLVGQRALVVEHALTYLQRYHAQEVQVVADLLARARQQPPPVDDDRLAAGLDRHFGVGDTDQRAAADLAVRSWTTVVTGGPGTGKTTTAAAVLALLAEQAAGGLGPGDAATAAGAAVGSSSASGRRPLRIGLAAPTGKAAARMQEALTAALVGTAERPGIIDSTPAEIRPAVEQLRDVEAVTLHRLLGKRPDSGTRFRHHRGNRLPHDVVLVDEASMVSLTHMARLLEALRPQARLILVGDPDQLVSVDAGAVLADLVAGADTAATSPVALARLRKVYRYGEAIGALAQALRDGDADAVVASLRAGRGGTGRPGARGDDAQVLWVEEPDPAAALEGLLTRQARAVYDHAQAGDADAALAAMGRHRLLCAHREGPFGVRSWNARVEGWLREATGDGLYDPMYVGRPLLVTANDYATGVVNGDTGVVVASHEPDVGGPSGPARRARRLAVIAGADGRSAAGGGDVARGADAGPPGHRVYAPSRLGDVETLHAMTIHKAQGSQADAVTVLLPEAESPLLTRELLYTGVTRAKSQVRVVGSEDVVRAAVGRRVVRASGLRQRLGAVVPS